MKLENILINMHHQIIEYFMNKYWLIQIGGRDNHYNPKRVGAFYENIIKKLDTQ